MVLGFVLIAAGIGLAFLWPQAFLYALQGVLILGLMLVGLVNVLIGLSKRRAHRDLENALRDEPGDEGASAASAPPA
jgi:hypothetical protein